MPSRPFYRQIVRVVRRPGTQYDGVLTIDGQFFQCQIGRSGVTHVKREGDGASPAARMSLLELRYRADRVSRPPGWFGQRARVITGDDGWCDDIGQPANYNRPVTRPFAGGHEEMARVDHLYDIVGILDWNISRRSLNRGSAIFLHQSRDDRGPTAGCIALTPHDLRLLLSKLRPIVVFEIA